MWSFGIGGGICTLGQIITDICLKYGIDKKTSSMVTTISLIFIGAFFTALKLYAKLGKHAGAGSIIPITGFSNSIVSPAIEFKLDDYILGLGSNMFKVAGPVLVYGITTSALVGLIYWILKLFM